MSKGSISKRKDGRYSVRVSVNGKTITKYAKSPEAAELLRQELTGDSKPEDLTLSELARRWLASANLKPTTEQSYRITLDKHILPALGGSKLVTAVKPADVAAVISVVRSKGLSDRSTQYAYVVLRRLLQVAYEWQLVEVNAAARVAKPRNSTASKDTWTKEETKKFLAYVSASGEMWGKLWLVGLLSGCRIGELLAVKFEDVENGGVVIKRSLAELNGGKFIIQTPKNATSNRFVLLPEAALKAITSLKDLTGSEFVFRYPVNHNPPLRSSLRRCFITACKNSGVKYISIHGLRRVHTTILAASGVSVKAAQTRLGHSTPSMTLKIYTHILVENDSQTVTALNKFLGV